MPRRRRSQNRPRRKTVAAMGMIWQDGAFIGMLQRHIFVRLHAPFIEYAEADQFSLTLYASQPNDVPRLSPSAHKDLYRTVSSLIGFPEASVQGLRDPPWPEFHAPAAGFSSRRDLTGARDILKLRAQILRAAFGIIRSVYSLSCLARFDPQHGSGRSREAEPPALRRGFIEDHRLLVRWMPAAGCPPGPSSGSTRSEP